MSYTAYVDSFAVMPISNVTLSDSHWPQSMAAIGAVLISLKNSGRCTLDRMEFGGPAGSAPCGPGRHCAPAPPKAVRARPQPRLLSPCYQPAVIHRRVPEPGPDEPQDAGAAVFRHRQPPRRVRQLLGAFKNADEESGALARELTVPLHVISGLYCWGASR